MQSRQISSEKSHYVFLDGLRGVAAALVAVFHACLVFKLGWRPEHAYLAVDFFFCLSGFVIAYAYDDRLAGSMSFGRFALKRVIRLYPMIFAGIGFGIAYVLLSGTVIAPHAPLPVFVLATLALLPAGLAFGIQAYPLNNVLWSLFFEFFANFLYGLCGKAVRSAVKTEILFLFLSGSVLLLAILHFHSIELIGFSYPGAFLAGFARVLFPFSFGVFLYRWNLRLPAVHWTLPAVLLVVLLGTPITAMNWLYDFLCIALAFPMIVGAGANVRLGALPSSVMATLGRISYPLYAIHLPLLKTADYLYRTHPDMAEDMPRSLAMALSVGVAIAVSYLAVTLYDEPVRRFLSRIGAPEAGRRAADPLPDAVEAGGALPAPGMSE